MILPILKSLNNFSIPKTLKTVYEEFASELEKNAEAKSSKGTVARTSIVNLPKKI